MGYHQFRDSVVCASVITRDLGAGTRVWLLPAWREETDEMVSEACRKLWGSLFGRGFDPRHLHFNDLQFCRSFFLLAYTYLIKGQLLAC